MERLLRTCVGQDKPMSEPSSQWTNNASKFLYVLKSYMLFDPLDCCLLQLYDSFSFAAICYLVVAFVAI